MSYLISQMWLCLLIAFVLGAILGYLWCKIFCCGSKNNDNSYDNLDLRERDLMPAKTVAAAPVSAAMVAPEPEPQAAIIPSHLDGDDYVIETLEGIGPQTGKQFRSIGVATVGDYLRHLHTAEQRDDAAEKLEIRVKPLHAWATMADLLRIGGVNHQYSELLQESGILTIGQLADSEARSLTAKMEEVNVAGKQKIAPEAPSLSEVSAWVKEATTMGDIISL